MLVHAPFAVALVAAFQLATAGTNPPTPAPTPSPAAVSLGKVTIAQPVLANGLPLAPGTYDVRLTGESLVPLPGQTPGAERVVEFVLNGQVVAKEVATLRDPESDVVGTSGDARPTAAPRIQLLKGGEFLRLAFSHAGARYLVHLPTAHSQE